MDGLFDLARDNQSEEPCYLALNIWFENANAKIADGGKLEFI